jgi:hypothetical protein
MILGSAESYAAELMPRVANNAVGASVLDLPFPETLVRDLTSGFESRIFIRVSLLASGKIVGHRDGTVTAKYDLWEEQFAIRKFIGDSLVNEMTFKKAQEVMAYLAHVELDSLFSADSAPNTQEVVLRADVSINPVEREKIERVRKWVAGNSAPGNVAADPAGTPLTSKPNDLFNKIFEQYIRGEDIVATWKLSITSKPFNPHTQLDAIPK